jgi:hypothetical protein
VLLLHPIPAGGGTRPGSHGPRTQFHVAKSHRGKSAVEGLGVGGEGAQQLALALRVQRLEVQGRALDQGLVEQRGLLRQQAGHERALAGDVRGRGAEEGELDLDDGAGGGGGGVEGGGLGVKQGLGGGGLGGDEGLGGGLERVDLHLDVGWEVGSWAGA